LWDFGFLFGDGGVGGDVGAFGMGGVEGEGVRR
jgi:hypothetical protein